MFCPKCGKDNPENSKFCRACGMNLGGLTTSVTSVPTAPLVDGRGRTVSLEGAITRFTTGLAFLGVTIALAFTRAGRNWWFWMLIPAFSLIGTGIAQYIQYKNAEGKKALEPAQATPVLPAEQYASLPPQTSQPANYSAPESKFRTGDLVPPSVTEPTTKLLEKDDERPTMTLPTRDGD
jgi:hypothetical protein